jgi:ABC-type Fe3+ transport system substrate-binding protein
MGSSFTCKLNPCCGDRRNCTPPRQYSESYDEPEAALSPAWIKTTDGIWPMYTSPCLRMVVTQTGRGRWSWVRYYGHFGTREVSSGSETTLAAARMQAVLK